MPVTEIEKPNKLKLFREEDYKKSNGMTQAEYADHREISRQAVFKHKHAGRLILLDNGNIDVEASDVSLDDDLDPAFTGNADEQRGVKKGPEGVAPKGGNKEISFLKEKAKEKKYQAGIVELNYLERNKELVSAKETEKAAYECGRMLRESLKRVPEKAITKLLSTFGIDASIENIKKGQKDLAGEINTAIEGV